MNLPGFCCKHKIIKDTCRDQKGDFNAFQDATDDIDLAVQEALKGWPKGKGTQIHIAVTVERGNG